MGHTLHTTILLAALGSSGGIPYRECVEAYYAWRHTMRVSSCMRLSVRLASLYEGVDPSPSSVSIS